MKISVKKKKLDIQYIEQRQNTTDGKGLQVQAMREKGRWTSEKNVDEQRHMKQRSCLINDLQEKKLNHSKRRQSKLPI